MSLVNVAAASKLKTEKVGKENKRKEGKRINHLELFGTAAATSDLSIYFTNLQRKMRTS